MKGLVKDTVGVTVVGVGVIVGGSVGVIVGVVVVVVVVVGVWLKCVGLEMLDRREGEEREEMMASLCLWMISFWLSNLHVNTGSTTG